MPPKESNIPRMSTRMIIPRPLQSSKTPRKPSALPVLSPSTPSRARAKPTSGKLTSNDTSPTPVLDRISKSKPAHTSTVNPRDSPYQYDHVGDACIVGSLVHHLDCGHKVMTAEAEHCGSNCQRPLPERIVKWANQKSSRRFICASCVENQVQKHRSTKRTLFLSQFETDSPFMASMPDGWKESQLQYWDRVWDNDMEKERAEFAKLGKECILLDCADDVVQTEARSREERKGVPWPPKVRPKPNRSPEWTLREETSKQVRVLRSTGSREVGEEDK